MVRQWRARSAAHERTWAEVAEIHGMAGSVLKNRRSAARRAKLGLTRRNVILGIGAGLGTLAAGKVILPWAILNARADHITRTAEISRIPLPDGSVATLGPDSAIALAYSDQLRRIDLLAGMSYFDVADDGHRPFQVAAERMSATASSAAFDISIDDGYLSFGVNRGVLDVRMQDPSQQLSERVAAGKWLSINDSTLALERGARDPSQIAAWRDGMIVAEREAVSSVVTRIARWLPGQVVMADPTLASRRVSGVFDLAHPIAALEAVVHPFGGHVRQLSSYLTVISPV
jgi:transmembrane sensor